jgi:tRNA U34 5-methylaminomethyl-2-thiouridine-forming methyltransferase MnmC
MPEIVVTEDGSITCLDAETGELYHNRAGAYTEALRNYVLPSGLEVLLAKQNSLRVLDVCFGLGYNSFVLIQHLLSLLAHLGEPKENFSLELIGLDQDRQIFDLVAPVLESANFTDLPNGLIKATSDAANKFKQSSEHQVCHFSSLVGRTEIAIKLEMRLADVRRELPLLVGESPQSFDLIFHDGFSPRRVPELWTIDLFHHYVGLLKPTGKILTYSSAVAVRGAFQLLGLIVKRTVAVGRKTGGTIASLQDDFDGGGETYPLTAEEDKRLSTASATPYRDPGLIGERRQILLRREKEITDLRLNEKGER